MTQYNELIKAKVIADSVSAVSGIRMTTMEIEYPRFILAELNTHRMLSKNSASSRAIPVKTMLDHINASPAGPVHWGKNQAGMQAKEELAGSDLSFVKYLWEKAKSDAVHWAGKMSEYGTHKQITNRITEPWMTMKTVISGTEWENFFWLRDHDDAQPEIADLAKKMREAYNTSEARLLFPGEWHVPYVNTYRDSHSRLYYFTDEKKLSPKEARVISASCCAQVSYRKNDDSYEKAEKIYKQLIESEPAHASPVEHQASPMDIRTTASFEPDTWEYGVTHVTTNGDLWSGNLRTWIQHRKLIPSEAKW